MGQFSGHNQYCLLAGAALDCHHGRPVKVILTPVSRPQEGYTMTQHSIP